jgi:tetratricopeptide (TPR) repeat protein
LFVRGRCYTNLNRHDEAIADYKAFINVQRNDPFAHYCLAHAYQAKGDLDNAVAAFNDAIRLAPSYAEAHCDLGQALEQKGQFTEALTARKKGHELGTKRPNWPHPSAKWVARCERLVQLDARLPAILKGEAKPKDAAEQIELAQVCTLKRLYGAAVGFYESVYTAQKGTNRFAGIRAAALAGCGKDTAAKADDRQHARWREQALAWLKADLVVWKKQLESNDARTSASARRMLTTWLASPDLAGVRDKQALDQLPAVERESWRRLWTEVETLVKEEVRSP